MMQKYNYKENRTWRRNSVIMMIFASIVSAIYTWVGLKDSAFSDGNFIPFLRVLSSCVLSIFCWSFLLHYFPNASKKARWPLKVFFIGTVVMTISLSTQFNTSGLASEKAMSYHINTLLDDAYEKLNIVTRSRKEELEIKNIFENEARQMKLNYETEKRGGVTGRKGDRMGARIFLTVAQGLQGIADNLNNRLDVIERNEQSAKKMLNQIRDTVDNLELSMTEKNARVQRYFNAFSDLISNLNSNADYKIAVSAAENLDTSFLLDTEVMGLTSTRKSQRIQALRKQIFASLKKPLAKIKASVHEKAMSLSGNRTIKIPRYRVMNDRIQAIGVYFFKVYSEVATSLAVDLGFPILGLFVLWFIPRFSQNSASISQQTNKKEENNDNPNDKETSKSNNGGLSIATLLDGLDHRRA